MNLFKKRNVDVSNNHRVLGEWRAVVFFLVMTIFLTWPLMNHLDAFVISQVYPSAAHSDLAWHLEMLQEAKTAFWHAQNPLMLSMWEVSALYLLVGIPFLSVGMQAIVFHNLFFLAVLFCTGFFMYLFVNELLRSDSAGLVAGFAYMSSSYIIYAYDWGHAHTIQIQFIPLIFLFIERILRSPSPRISDSLKLGVVLLCQVLAVSQTTVYLTFFIPLWLAFRLLLNRAHGIVQKRRMVAQLRILGFAFIFGLLLCAPFLYLKLNTSTVIRTLEENSRRYWILESWREFLTVGGSLHPGVIPLILGLGGIAMLLWRQKLPGIALNFRESLGYLAIMVVSFFCMFGPVAVWLPYTWLYQFWPLVNHFRVPSRTFPIFLFALALFTAVGFLWITENRILKVHRFAIAIAIILLMVTSQVLISPWWRDVHLVMGPFPYP